MTPQVHSPISTRHFERSPLEWLNLRLRLRYLNEEAFEGERKDKLTRTMSAGEESIWGYLEALFLNKKRAHIKTRYEVYAWIDDRTTTLARRPNPAHWLRLELEYRF